MIIEPDRSTLPEDRGPQHSLACPHCHQGTGSDVVDTRALKDVVRRRRICRACHTRFTTYERSIDPLVFEQQRDRAKAIAAQLREMAAALEVW
jgi:transcriptional regulator NrdR family protein